MMEANKKYMFVGGNISGIQRFIYNVSSKKAMVSLKGRSAYLRNYTFELCDGLTKLPDVQNRKTVYCSGGKFYLIVEDNDKARNAIMAYSHRCEKELWEKHKGQLGLAIAYVAFETGSRQEIFIDGKMYPSIGILWKQISEKFARLKNRKFERLLSEDYASFFEVIPVGGATKVCAITGIEDPACIQLADDQNGEGIWILPSVKEQIELGCRLRDKEHFLTLSDYADNTYLGILRMDVDGLGARFIKGFGSFAEYMVFSDRLSHFFQHTVFEIQQGFADTTSIVYAGGDDLFVVGRWDCVVDFAEAVRKRFVSDFHGEGITISGGMAVVGEKYPIAKAAEMAGQAEDEAKHYNCGEKNAFSFLGECVSWNEEFDTVKSLKDEFVTQIKEHDIPQGLLHQVLKYSEMAKAGDVSWYWHSTYYFTRLHGRINEENLVARDFIGRMRTRMTLEDHKLLGLAARWAELLLRMEE